MTEGGALWWSVARFPVDMHGNGLLVQCGVLLDRCPFWHLDKSPYSRLAASLVSIVANIRRGIEHPPEWTAVGARCAELADVILNVCKRDADERRMPKPKKGKGGRRA
jgi:hypothetical protein